MGQVWPNPSVGCILVKNGRVVGQGVTAPGGRPHAEPQALAQAGDLAKAATVYVTLEPCAHTGQTPPCAQALIDAQVARVVVAARDPDPRVDGGGIAMLRDAGIAVTTDVETAQAKADHAGFFLKVREGRPFVTLKLATTLDGRIATHTGESQWITGPESRRAVHALRARHDAVMVGAGTLRADDPQLTVRDMGVVRQPVRVVVSTGLDLPPTAQMFATTDRAPVWLCHGPDADASQFVGQGAVSLPCAVSEGRVSIESVLATLGQQGLTRVFCEGGGALAASILRAGLVDQLELFQAGKVIGGDGLAAVAPLDLAALGDCPQFACVQERRIGGDVWTTWRPDV